MAVYSCDIRPTSRIAWAKWVMAFLLGPSGLTDTPQRQYLYLYVGSAIPD